MSIAANGVWQVMSESDPRWQASGQTCWAVMGGIPPEAKEAIEELKKTLGEPPEDLEYSFDKY